MNTTAQHTIDIASALGCCGVTVASIEAHTPDGRTWRIEAASEPGGFRLFEMDPEYRTALEEHDAADGTWTVSDLADYLDAVGRIKR